MSKEMERFLLQQGWKIVREEAPRSNPKEVYAVWQSPSGRSEIRIKQRAFASEVAVAEPRFILKREVRKFRVK